MALVINSNMASLATQRNLATAQADSATTLQRLSSGLRINSAKDDAAGLTIAESFTKQVNGFNQAARNANDAVSLVQTAEGALKQVSENLQRVRELAVQASSDSYTDTERALLQKEVTALVNEIDRIAEATTFNGSKLVDGNYTGKVYQVGAFNTANDRISSGTFVDVNSAALGATQASVTSAMDLSNSITAGFSAGGVTINGNNVSAVADPGFADGGSYSKTVANALMQADSTVTATVGSTTATLGVFTALTDADAGAGDTYTLSINGVTIMNAVEMGTLTTAAKMDTAFSNVSASLATAGITFSGAAATGITLTATDGRNIEITQTDTQGNAGAAAAGGFANAAFAAGAAVTNKAYAAITLTSGSNIVMAGGEIADIGLTATTTAASVSAIGSGSIATLAGAQTMIDTVDAAMTTVNGGRADLGALQSRFESVANSLSVSAETAAAARSRVQDADFAAESANLARNQVLQQAGISMLAQANAMPQQVLALLQ